MIDVTDYQNGLIRLGADVRDILNLKQNQDVFLYEDIPNAQLILTMYSLQRPLYHSIILFKKIEDFINLGEKLSSNGVNIFYNFFYRFGDMYRMSMEFELQEYKTPLSWNETNFITEFHKISDEHSVEVSEIYSYSDMKIERVKKILAHLKDLSNLREPEKVSISPQNWTCSHNLTQEFRLSTHLENGRPLRCVQIADPSASVLIMTFHNSNIEKVGLEYIHLPGSLTRIVNIFRNLNIEIVASDNHVISLNLGRSMNGFFMLKYPQEFRDRLHDLKYNFEDTEMRNKLIEIDKKLTKTDSSHQQLVNSHTKILTQLGFTDMSIIRKLTRYSIRKRTFNRNSRSDTEVIKSQENEM